jgi:hypothetical protein
MQMIDKLGIVHLIDKKGRISPDGKNFSDTWRIVDAVIRNNFGYAIRFYSLAEIISNPSAIPWQHKNGKQCTFLRYLDHGNVMEKCNPPYRLTK